MAGARIEVAFFDVGGVILSNAWDHNERRRVVEGFGLERAEIDARHERVAEALERAEITLDDYLAEVIFFKPRAFSQDEFKAAMRAQSVACDEPMTVVAAAAQVGRARFATLNNEGLDLNAYRIEHFGLRRFFGAFCSSCYLGVRKPETEIYTRAMGVMQAAPEACLFVDDRAENVAAARALGMDGVQFTGAAELQAQLIERGLL